MKTIHLLGDSIVKAYGDDRNNFIGGWGDHLQSFFDNSQIQVIDYAQGGRSTRSFLNEGRFIDNGKFSVESDSHGFGPAYPRIQEGDYVLMQFAHNDDDSKIGENPNWDFRMVPLGTPDANGIYPSVRPDEVEPDAEGNYTYECGATYKGYFKFYIDKIREKKAIPVLVTPVSRITLEGHTMQAAAGNHGGTDAFGAFPYVRAVRQVAEEEQVVCLDLFTKTKEIFELLGETDAFYLQSMKDNDGNTIGEVNYNRPAQWVQEFDRRVAEHDFKVWDNTHQNRIGSFIFAGKVAELIHSESRLAELHQNLYQIPVKSVQIPAGLMVHKKELEATFDWIQLFGQKLYIGVDLGTSSVKLVMMNAYGHLVRTVTREYPLSFPKPGWSEQNPADWYTQSMDGLKELVQGFEQQIAGISFGGQMHGLVVLDEADEVIRPAILWNDGRTTRECEYLNETIGREKLSEYTANIAFAGFTAPKILWMKANEPENFARISKIMLPKDYLAYKLTGVFCTDVSDASGMLLLDVKNRCWSEPMLELCGITRQQLPALYESYEQVGLVKPELAAALGLSSEVVVAAGAGDNAAAAIGTGTLGDGRCNISLGTSGTVFISSSKFGVDEHNALHSFDHADGSYHLMGCMLSAASCNKWWLDDVIGTKDYAKEQADITEDKLGNNHVFFLPYLMGERSPHNNPNARGTWTGMTMDTGRSDMTQSVLEGVAFAIRDSFEVAKSLGIQIQTTKICGGGAKSPLWRKIIANVLNINVEQLSVEEGPGMGAAMLAMVACKAYPTVEAAAETVVQVSGVTQPDPAIAARYEKKYQQFVQIYPALKGVFDVICQE